jgi:hypothetical protein
MSRYYPPGGSNGTFIAWPRAVSRPVRPAGLAVPRSYQPTFSPATRAGLDGSLTSPASGLPLKHRVSHPAAD